MKRNLKIGLALEGGGAKGAYAFGALRALTENNIEFDAISGTSVGGLNAFLLGTSNMQYGLKLWLSLTRDRIYPFRRPAFLFYLLFPLLFLIAIFNLYITDSNFDEINKKIEKGVLAVYYPSVIVLAIVLIREVLLTVDGRMKYFEAVVIVVVALWILSTIVLSPYDRKMTNYSIWIMIGLYYVSTKLEGMTALLFYFSAIALALSSKYISKLMTVIVNSITLFNSRPLKKELDALIRKSQFAVPIYVAAACKKDVWDPDKYCSICTGNDGTHGGQNYYDWYSPPQYIPRYYSLNTLSHGDMLSALLATAALPLGIVPSVKIKDEMTADGGMCDNIPLYPLIKYEECDVILLISLSPEDKDLKKHYMIVDRLLRLETSKKPVYSPQYSFEVHNDPPRELPHIEITNWPKIYIFKPRESLGGFISGTLNFTQEYSERLLKQGYNEMMDRLDEFRSIIHIEEGTPEGEAMGSGLAS